MDTDTVEKFLAISIMMVVSFRFTACGQEWTALTPTKTLGTPITVARLTEIETTTTLLPATMPPIEPQQTTSMATSDQNSNMKCRQTIQDVYRKTFCPDKKLVLEDLFTQSFELYKAAWMASCDNGPFTEVVDIAGPTIYTTGYHSYVTTVKLWYPEGKGSGSDPHTFVVFIDMVIDDNGVCRIASLSGGG